MRAFFVEADYAPRDGYVLSEREKATGRALRGNQIWKNIRGKVTDRPMPVCGDDQVLLKVGAAGICGTDAHLLKKDADGYSMHCRNAFNKCMISQYSWYGGSSMKVFKMTLVRLAAVIVALSLCTGCGTKETVVEEPQEKSLALLLSQEDDFLTDLKQCIEAEVEKQGYVLHYYTAEGDPETQIAQVHEVLAAGVDTLIVNLTNDETGERIVDIVGDANVVFVNRAPTNRAILNENTVFVGMDEAQCGALQGKALAEYFWEEEQGTEIRYLMFQGVSGLENTNERSNGAIKGLLDVSFTPVAAAEFQICDFYREEAFDAMTNLLAEDVAYDCIICNNDAMALGVIDALEAAGKNPAEVPIVGIDNTEDGAKALASGKLYMTVDQDAQTQAEAAVAAAINLDQGVPFDEGIHLPLDTSGQIYPFTIRIPVSAVTA